MRLPIDTTRLKFLVVAPAEPLRQFEEGKPREQWAPRTNRDGELLWRVQVVALGDGEAEGIRVSVPGEPDVSQGEMVRVEALTAQPWEMDGRSGVSFRCQAIRSASGRAAGAAEKAAAEAPPAGVCAEVGDEIAHRDGWYASASSGGVGGARCWRAG